MLHNHIGTKYWSDQNNSWDENSVRPAYSHTVKYFILEKPDVTKH